MSVLHAWNQDNTTGGCEKVDEGVTPTFVKKHPVQGAGTQQDSTTQTPVSFTSYI